LIQQVKDEFKNPAMVVVALLVDRSGKLIDGFDANDDKLSSESITKFRKIISI
jgi:hypothetical protein